jgi:hypothetical protein
MSLGNWRVHFLQHDGPGQQLAKTVEVISQGRHVTLKMTSKEIVPKSTPNNSGIYQRTEILKTGLIMA